MFSLDFIQSPNPITEAGNQIGTIIVRVEDQQGILADDFTGTVDLVITPGTGGPAASDAVLIGTTSVQLINGVATFPALVMTRAGVDFTITASVSGASDGLSNVFTITPGPPWRLMIREILESESGSDLAKAANDSQSGIASEHNVEGNRIPLELIIFDEYDNETGVEEGDTPVLISTSSPTGRFFITQTSTQAVDRVVFPVRNSRTIVYYEDPTPGELQVDGVPQPPPGAREITPANAPLVIRMPASLRSLPEEYTARIFERKRIEVSLRSADNVAVRASSPGVNVSIGTSSATGLFYATASSTEPITSATILPAESRIFVYYADYTLGTHSLTFTGEGVPNPTDVTLATIIEGPANAQNSIAEVPNGQRRVPTTITLRLYDELGNPVFNGTDQIQISISNGPNAGAEFTIVDNGDGTYSITYIPENAGTDHIDIVINGTPMTNSPFPSVVADDQPARLVLISGNDQHATITQALAEELVVQVLSETDLPVAGTSVRFEIVGYPDGAAEMGLDPEEGTSDIDGFTSTVLTVGTRIGQYTVRASVEGLDPVYFNAIAGVCIPTFAENDPCGPYSYEVSLSDASPDIGGEVTVTAQLVDRFGNPVSFAGVVVNWSSSENGTFSALTSTTDENGRAVITYTVTNIVGSRHVITATDEHGSTGDSEAIVVSGGGLSSVKIVGPDSARVSNLAGPFELVLMDEYRNEIVAPRDLTFRILIDSGMNFEVYRENAAREIQATGSDIVSIPAFTSRSRFFVNQNEIGLKTMEPMPFGDTWIDSTFNKEVLFYNTPDDAQILSLIAGQGQRERVNNRLAERLTVTVIDQYDNPIRNVLLTFKVTDTPNGANGMRLVANETVAVSKEASEGMQSVSMTLPPEVLEVSGRTDENGQMAVIFYLGDKAGDYTIDASAEGLNMVTFIATAIPGKYTLNQNYPNPFNASTKIVYEVPVESNVLITVYNTLGQRVATLVDGVRNTGVYTIDLDASRLGLASGVYIYHMSALGLENGSQFVKTHKMLYVK